MSSAYSIIIFLGILLHYELLLPLLLHDVLAFLSHFRRMLHRFMLWTELPQKREIERERERELLIRYVTNPQKRTNRSPPNMGKTTNQAFVVLPICLVILAYLQLVHNSIHLLVVHDKGEIEQAAKHQNPLSFTSDSSNCPNGINVTTTSGLRFCLPNDPKHE